MKPRNELEKQVAASNKELTAIGSKAVEWAIRNAVKHITFRTSEHKCTCGDCGEQFGYKGKGKSVRCPHCGHRLQVTDTLKRKHQEKSYFSTLEVIGGLQVQRVFLLTAIYCKGRPMDFYYDEVCRLWLNAKGQVAVTSRLRAMGYYRDSFCFASPIELRNMSDVHLVISDAYTCPYYSVLSELRRNGMKGKLPDCHPFELMKALLADHRMETMMKARDFKAVEYFIYRSLDLNTCWQSYKVASRHHYRIEDFGTWCDTIRLLEKCGKDIHNAKYICPLNLKAEHDHWLKKANAIERKRRDMERIAKVKIHEAEFYKNKSCYFGIIISDGDIEISVLDSLEAYKEEGNKMKHCVFQCEYYAKTDSVVLSAHDHLGNRIETVEFSLSQGKVVQSRGVCNSNTEYHDRIIRLVNENAYRFIEARRASA